MRIGLYLHNNLGYTRTVARKSGATNQIVSGTFNPRAAYGAGDADTLARRYGLERSETAGTVEGEAGNVDPQVIVDWLKAGEGLGLGAKEITLPDAIDVADLRQISKNGQTTAFGDLIKPYLERIGKPVAEQPAEPSEGAPVLKPVLEELAAIKSDLSEANARLVAQGHDLKKIQQALEALKPTANKKK